MNFQSNPEFSDFENTIPAKSVGNHSLIFTRTDHSWHGVNEINSPEGVIRKLFMVEVSRIPTFTEKELNRMKDFIHR
jgi:hypothetical protein